MFPNLFEIINSLLEAIPPNFPKADVNSYLENLLNFFFSSGSMSVTENDIKCFLTIINEHLTLDNVAHDEEDITSTNTPEEGTKPKRSLLHNVLTPAMGRHFLRRILTHKKDNMKPVKPLCIFYKMVSIM